MKVNADLYVRDVPGQLVGTLDPISAVDGNIVGVVHDREKMINQRIGVNITFEIPSADSLERLKNIWRSKDVLISSISSVIETYLMEYMLIGDVNAKHVDELIDKARRKVDIDSIDVRIRSKPASSKNAVMISANVGKKEDVRKLDEFIASSCARSKITYIRGVEE